MHSERSANPNRAPTRTPRARPRGSWKRALVFSVAEIVALLVLHSALMVYMAAHDVVSKIFAAGSHVPRTTLALAVLFLVVRLLTVLGMPGIILSRAGLVACEAVAARRRRTQERSNA